MPKEKDNIMTRKETVCITLAPKRACTGCTACHDVCPKGAITMQPDATGFVYPHIEASKCVECHLCEKVCPILKPTPKPAPYLKTFAGYASDKAILRRSTTGAVAATLSEHTVEMGGSVVGVEYNPDFTGVRHKIHGDKEGIENFTGSKYVQSQKDGVFKETAHLLKSGQKVLFTGCPCEIDGLLSYLGNQATDNLLTCELVCMGVGSPKVLADYVGFIEKRYDCEISSLKMRSKCRGWFVPTMELKLADGKTIKKTLYASQLGRSTLILNRPSCFNCRYRGVNGKGDIRIGDFWGVKKTDSYWNPDGVSCIFVRTDKGLEAIGKLEKKGFKLFETDYCTATQNNMSSELDKGGKYEELSKRFGEILADKGLFEAVKATSDWRFRLKQICPDRLHPTLKHIYHFLRDKK